MIIIGSLGAGFLLVIIALWILKILLEKATTLSMSLGTGSFVAIGIFYILAILVDDIFLSLILSVIGGVLWTLVEKAKGE